MQDAYVFDFDLDDVTVLQQDRRLGVKPTPAGVPVAVMSPGSSVINCVMKAMVAAVARVELMGIVSV